MRAFRAHIEEAIVLNFNRLPGYAKASDGRSIPVSLGLILFEVLIWPVAFFFDVTGRKWFRRDRKVIMDDLISMDKTPDFRPHERSSDRPGRFARDIESGSFRFTLFNYLREKKWAEADLYLQQYRKDLDISASHQLYLYKHFLESIHRSVRLTFLWLEKGRVDDRERNSFLKHRFYFTMIQTLGLEYCILLDYLAHPLYQKGIPIIKGDVPEIPIPESID